MLYYLETQELVFLASLPRGKLNMFGVVVCRDRHT